MKKSSPIRESRKIEVQYRKSLLVRANWLKENEAQIIRELKSNEARYQSDAPANELRAIIAAARKRYLERFPIAMTKRLAKNFYKRIDSYNSKKMGSAFKALGIDLESALKRENLTDYAGIAIQNQVDLISSISGEYFDKVEKIVYNGMQSGLDHEALGKKIQEATGVSAKRAKFIARDSTSTINSQLSVKRAANAGITKFVWLKTKMSKTSNYTPRKSHLAVDNKVFDLDKGAYVDGKWTFPGYPIGCTCAMSFVV